MDLEVVASSKEGGSIEEKVEVASTPKTVVLWGSKSVFAGYGQLLFAITATHILPRCIDLRFESPSLYLIFHPIEKQLSAKVLEELILNPGRDEGLEVQEIEIGLVVDLAAF